MNYLAMQTWSVEEYHDLFQRQGLIPKPEEERMEILELTKKKRDKHQQLLLAAEKRQKVKVSKKMGYEDTDTEWHITRYKKGKENDDITVQQQRQEHHGTQFFSNNLIKDNEPEAVVRKFKRDNNNKNNHQQENKEEFPHREAQVHYTISIDKMSSDEMRQEHGNNNDKNTPEKEFGVDESILLADETIFGDNSEEKGSTWWVLHFVKKYLTCQF